MQLGLGPMRLSPADFWAMTPRELEAALIGAGLLAGGSGGAFGRADLAGLMAAFPDL